MRAVVLTRHGAPEVLRVTEQPDPLPGPGTVLVRVEAIGINYAEILSRKGLYGWAPKRPYVPGMEAAGRIEAVGDGVDRTIGEAVVVGSQFGCYAERVVVPAALALPAVPGFSIEENAAFPVNWMTAWVGLREMARVRPTDRVAVSPAGGGVGTAAVQIASALGCDVVALAGSDEKLADVRSLGASHIVNYRKPAWREALAGAGPLEVALEMVGGDVFRGVRDALGPFGRIVVAGYADLDYTLWNPLSWWRALRGVPRMSLKHMFTHSNGLLSTHLGHLLENQGRMHAVWKGLLAFVLEHDLRPQVGHVLPFALVAEAHRLIESRKSYGKVVLKV